MKKKKTTIQFIKEASIIHDNKYDYSKVVYTGCTNKVIIICNEHGEFIQSPANHLQGQACKLCYFDSGRITQENFIRRSAKKHNNKYDYSKTIYNGIRKDVIVICPIHGEFIQTAEIHLKGSGCRKCTKHCGKTTEQFISEAKSAHGNRYDYSQVEYINSKKKVKIICREHGEFYQIAGVHLLGKNCPECSNCKRHDNKSFIKKAEKVHGKIYDYSIVNYIKTGKKVNIICKKHGIFKQKPNSHLNGHGCPKCADERGSILRALSTEEFILKAKNIHGDLYEYHEVKYINQNKKIKVFCDYHQKFFMTVPSNHLSGTGCPLCNNSRGEVLVTKILEENELNFIPQKRFKDCKLKRELPFDFFLTEKKVLIEYNGKQHYEFVEHLHKTEENFLNSLKRDEIKRNFAIENGIKLIEIPYWIKEKKDIEKVILEEINNES